MVAFDKTVTLTKGKPVVTEKENFSEKEIDSYVAALESHSHHPLAQALIKDLDHKNVSEFDIKQFRSLTGKGVEGVIENQKWKIGSPALFEGKVDDALIDKISYHQEDGKTVILVSKENKIVGLYALADTLREEASQTVKQLHQLGIEKTVMLTGDNAQTGQAIAQQVGVTEVYTDCMPEVKLQKIKQLVDQVGQVAMVGDGVNDAPALAASSVGIAMGTTGTDTALKTADIALMGDDLRKLPFTIKLSRKALRIIKANITFALLIKLAALLLVVPGWLTLWIAILSDLGLL